MYEIIGRNNATYFDAMGQPFFTREVYDLFYPGYGDTWNTHHGAIGSTYEQASARGLVFDRRDGDTLTYRTGVRNHFMASFATAEAVANNADRFLSDFAAYRSSNASGGAGRGTYVIDLATRRWNAERLGRRLVAQGIAVTRQDGPVNACGRSYPKGYLAISQAQPAARLVRALLDKNTELPREFVVKQEERRDEDLRHELYDVTAWSVPLMSGLDASLCNGPVSGDTLRADAPITPVIGGSGDFAVAVPWTDSGQARLVTLALREGLSARVTDEAFTSGGVEYPRGTVVFAAGSNEEGALERLEELSAQVGAQTSRLASGWVEDGPNLGSASFVKLTLPKVALAWDEGMNQLSAGAMRYVLEQRLGLPVTPIRNQRLARTDLSDYDVMIVPEGSPGRGMVDNLKKFVANGGVLVAIGRSLDAFARGDDPLLAVKREAGLGLDLSGPQGGGGGLAEASEIENEGEYRELLRNQRALPATLPGALLNVVADPNIFLSAG